KRRAKHASPHQTHHGAASPAACDPALADPALRARQAHHIEIAPAPRLVRHRGGLFARPEAAPSGEVTRLSRPTAISRSSLSSPPSFCRRLCSPEFSV